MGLAARGGHVEVCSWLLESGCSPKGLTATDVCGWTALHLAGAEGHKKAVEWLLTARVDLLAEDEEGRTAAAWAGLRGHNIIATMLNDMQKNMLPAAGAAAAA